MKKIKEWLRKWLGIDGLCDLTVYNIGQVRDKANKVQENVDKLEEWTQGRISHLEDRTSILLELQNKENK